MIVPTPLHPFEIWRLARLALKDCKGDFEIRFPEVRRRCSYEFEAKLPDIDKQSFEKLISRFRSAQRIVSILDYPLLLDWSERMQHAKSLISIHAGLSLNQGEHPQNEIVNRMRSRLKEIQAEFRLYVFEEQPTLWTLLKVRAKFSPLRDEANYLLHRLSQIESKIEKTENSACSS